MNTSSEWPESLSSKERYRLPKHIITGIAILSLSACSVEAQSTAPTPESVEVQEQLPSTGTVGSISFEETAQTTFDLDAAQMSVINYPDQYTPLINPNPNDAANPYDVDKTATAPLLEITYTDGEIHYNDETIGQTLDNAPKQQLLDAVATNHDLLEAAFRDDTLDIINFRIAKGHPEPREYSLAKPQYILEDYMNTDGGGAIYMTFDSHDTQTVADIATMLRHETLHALTAGSALSQRTSEVLPYSSDSDILAFAGACSSLRSMALEQVTENATKIIDQLETLSSLVPWQYSTQVEALIQLVRDGSIVNLQPAQDSPYIRTNSVLSECITFPPKVVLLNLLQLNGLDTQEFIDASSEEALEQLVQTIDEWGNALRDYTFYKAIRESPYLEAPMENELEGHPWDNWGELLASTLNVALTYPVEFTQNYRQLTQEEQAAIKTVLQLNAAEFRELHPELTTYHTELDNLIATL
ncbi:hypothetical protein EON76_04900 [bacterium]|nr:MAG: hypothetical protein EON76_04900 [bacterium]